MVATRDENDELTATADYEDEHEDEHEDEDDFERRKGVGKREDRRERERRREAVRRMLAKGMMLCEICEQLEKDGIIRKGKAEFELVLREIRAIRKEDARPRTEEDIRAATADYIRREEEIYKMALNGEKKDLKLADEASTGMAKAHGVPVDGVKLTREMVAKMPAWEAVVKKCGVFRQPDGTERVGFEEKKE